MADLDRLMHDIADVKRGFERFFAGLERVPPEPGREHVRRAFKQLEEAGRLPTALSFRLQTLRSSWSSLEGLWDRQLVRLEEGRTPLSRPSQRRTVASADSLRLAGATAALPPHDEPSSDVARLHEAYVAAWSKLGAPPPLAPEAFANLVRQHDAAVRQKTQCHEVQFHVLIKAGKPTLRAVPVEKKEA